MIPNSNGRFLQKTPKTHRFAMFRRHSVCLIGESSSLKGTYGYCYLSNQLKLLNITKQIYNVFTDGFFSAWTKYSTSKVIWLIRAPFPILVFPLTSFCNLIFIGEDWSLFYSLITGSIINWSSVPSKRKASNSSTYCHCVESVLER